MRGLTKKRIQMITEDESNVTKLNTFLHSSKADGKQAFDNDLPSMQQNTCTRWVERSVRHLYKVVCTVETGIVHPCTQLDICRHHVRCTNRHFGILEYKAL